MTVKNFRERLGISMIPTSRRKANKNKPFIIGGVIGVLAVICTVVILLFMGKDDNSSYDILGDKEQQSSEGDSMSEQESMKGEFDNSIEMPSTDQSGQNVAKRKEYYINFVDLAVLQEGGGSFDIHIRFPNGEDYVVVSNVLIKGITQEGFMVSLDDRENHMLSSARTDRDVYTGTSLYLARCENAVSDRTETDYPWNQFVLSAHGINEDDKEDIYAKRLQLEENLVEFMDQTLNR